MRRETFWSDGAVGLMGAPAASSWSERVPENSRNLHQTSKRHPESCSLHSAPKKKENNLGVQNR